MVESRSSTYRSCCQKGQEESDVSKRNERISVEQQTCLVGLVCVVDSRKSVQDKEDESREEHRHAEDSM